MCAAVPEVGEGLPVGVRQETLAVSFFDLSRIYEWRSSEDDARVAAFFTDFYRIAAEQIEGAGGRIVKLMGDAGMAVASPEQAEGLVFALADLALRARELGQEYGFDVYLNTSVHVGPVLSGEFGPPGAERFDVIGKTVNVAARLGRRGLTLSAQAFRCLSPEGRERFQKIKRPVNYRMRS